MRLPLLAITVLSLSPADVYAGDPSIADIQTSLNSAWLVLTGILVFFMQAGFALVESGMARAKNSVNVIMKNYLDACVGGIIFWAFGYGLMFGLNTTGWFGWSHFFPGELSSWDWTFMFFQMMFAATATTIASGAMAERIHFRSYLIGACLISGVIYPVFGSWAWGGVHGGDGWLKALGFIDFAGSTVVHSIGGWAALAGIIILGPRLGRFSASGASRIIPGHNLSMVALGGFILWFSWFGFNAGSTLAASANIGKIALNTHLAACAGAVGYLLAVKLLDRPLLLTGTVNASLGGLVGVTAGCATMDPQFAIVTGLIAGVITLFGPMLLVRYQIDDVVDAVSVHGFCGAWGTLAAGLFYSGDLFNGARLAIQAIGVCSGFLWGFGVAFAVYYAIKIAVGMRSTSLHEQRGLDYTEHAELGYPEFQEIAVYDTDVMNAKR